MPHDESPPGDRAGRKARRPREAIQEELEAHLEMAVRELVDGGMDPEDARGEAVRRFGRLERYRAACEAIRQRHRQARRPGVIVHDLLLDIRFAIRTLRRSPLFTLVVLTTLALGIGVNGAAFSVVDAVVLQPLPYGDADELFALSTVRPEGGEVDGLSYPDWLDLRDESRTLEELGYWVHWSYDVEEGGVPRSIESARVSPGTLEMLGVEPLLGRTFRPEEGVPGADRVVVLSHTRWRDRYGGDERLPGREILLDGEPYAVVGVMPAGFRFPYEGEFGRGFWTPMAMDPSEQSRHSRWLNPVGRLAAGATLEQARAEVETVAARLADAYPGSNAGRTFALTALHDTVVRADSRRAVWILYGVVGSVLLIACANLANLLLVRLESRQREMALRAALGAGRARLLRQLLTESGLLALAGGAAGLALAGLGLDVIVSLIPADLPRLDEVRIDGTVLLFTGVLSVAAGLFFRLLPARQAARNDLQDALKAAGTSASSRGRHRFRGTLAVTQVAVALVLLVGAGLLVRSFTRLVDEETGFDPRGVLMFEVAPDGDAPARLAFYEELRRRLEALPRVAAAGANSAPPLSGVDWPTAFLVADAPPPGPGQEPRAQFNYATPRYFQALGIRMVAGRAFTEEDRPDRPRVVVVNEALARRHWPDAGAAGAVGRRLRLGGSDADPGAPTLEIVGVIADVRKLGIDREPPPELFLPVSQNPGHFLNFVVRTDGDPLAMADAVRALVRDVRDDVAVESLVTLEQALDADLARPRFQTLLLAAFAALAVLLATVGIYGVISFSTAERTHEIGVRMALGAGADDVRRLVLRQGMLLTGAGVVTGLVATLGLARVLEGLLYEVSPEDPLTVAAVVVLLAAISGLASWIPARRATRVDPVIALRDE